MSGRAVAPVYDHISGGAKQRNLKFDLGKARIWDPWRVWDPLKPKARSAD